MIAAAQAAASWARARRATWTDVPLPRPVAPATVAPMATPFGADISEPEPFDEAIVVSSLRPPVALPPPPPPPPRPVTEERTPILPWLRRGGIAAAVALVVGAGGFFAMKQFDAARKTAASTAATAPPQDGKSAPRKTVGTLKVTSTPEGARVVIDGHDRGITPLTLEDVSIGTHTVSIEAKNGSVQRSVAVSADYVAQLDEQIFEGFVAIFSPIEVVISEGNRVLRPDDRSEIMLSPGTHRLRFENRALAYDDTRSIVVKPGEKTAYTLVPPKSTLTVSANDVAEVFLDGNDIGPTPVNAVPVSIGTHNLVVKRAFGGEKRMPITVTVKPFTVAVDF